MTTSGTLGPRALNRPLLSRQLLLERAAIAPVDAIERLVGLQAASILQSTQWGKDLAGADPEEIAAAGRALLDEAPRTRVELGRALARSWPDRDPASLAWAVTYLLPLVQVPPRGLWGARGQARWATATAWLGESPADATPAALDDLLLRYLAAFGPASVAVPRNLVPIRLARAARSATTSWTGCSTAPGGFRPPRPVPACSCSRADRSPPGTRTRCRRRVPGSWGPSTPGGITMSGSCPARA